MFKIGITENHFYLKFLQSVKIESGICMFNNVRDWFRTHTCCICHLKEMIIGSIIDKSILNITDHLERTPLFYAVAHRHIEAVKFLLDNDVDLHKKYRFFDGHGEFEGEIIFAAVLYSNNSTEIIKILIKHGEIPINVTNSNQNTPIFYAKIAGYNKVEEILYRTENPASNSNPIWKNHYYDISDIMLMTCYFNNYEALETILKDEKNNLNINESAKSGETSLYHAVINNSEKMVKLLLTHGVDGTKTFNHTFRIKNDRGTGNNDNNTLLIIASYYGYSDVLSTLLENGLNSMINWRNSDEISALYYAITENKSECVKILLQNGADINEEYREDIYDKYTYHRLINIASYRSNYNVMNEIINHDGNLVYSIDSFGNTPFSYGIQTWAMDVLMDSGAQITNISNIPLKEKLSISGVVRHCLREGIFCNILKMFNHTQYYTFDRQSLAQYLLIHRIPFSIETIDRYAHETVTIDDDFTPVSEYQEELDKLKTLYVKNENNSITYFDILAGSADKISKIFINFNQKYSVDSVFKQIKIFNQLLLDKLLFGAKRRALLNIAEKQFLLHIPNEDAVEMMLTYFPNTLLEKFIGAIHLNLSIVDQEFNSIIDKFFSKADAVLLWKRNAEVQITHYVA